MLNDRCSFIGSYPIYLKLWFQICEQKWLWNAPMWTPSSMLEVSKNLAKVWTFWRMLQVIRILYNKDTWPLESVILVISPTHIECHREWDLWACDSTIFLYSSWISICVYACLKNVSWYVYHWCQCHWNGLIRWHLRIKEPSPLGTLHEHLSILVFQCTAWDRSWWLYADNGYWE